MIFEPFAFVDGTSSGSFSKISFRFLALELRDELESTRVRFMVESPFERDVLAERVFLSIAETFEGI